MTNTNALCPCDSGRYFLQCHGGDKPPPFVPAPDVPMTMSAYALGADGRRHLAPLPLGASQLGGPFALGPQARAAPLAPPPVTLKLDLACGQVPRDGFEGVDIWEGAKHQVNLQDYPWPWADSSVAELHCSHYIEHIPMERVRHPNGATPSRLKDALFAFFDECHRILVPDGWITVRWPCSRSDRAFQDPTHRRFIPAQTALYLNRKWRELNGLSHYNVDCDYGVLPTQAGVNGSGLDVNPLVDTLMSALHPEVAARRMTHEWNTVHDFEGRFQAKK